jgi:recombination protein RecT
MAATTEKKEAPKGNEGTAVEKPGQDIAKHEPTMAERFTGRVVKEFEGVVGERIQLTPYQKRLAKNLYLAIDAALQVAEKKRSDPKKPPIIWANVNMTKLATDAMHRIDLGLDASIPATIYPIAYLNGRTQKYDLDLRIGYKGEDYYHRKTAIEPPVDVRYELVYSKDTFIPVKKDRNNEVEGYEFVPGGEGGNAFDRGEVVGGFGYIVHSDPTKNALVLVTAESFKKSEGKGNREFWENYPEEMKYSKLVRRTTSKIPLDPEKVSASYIAIQAEQDYIDAEIVKTEIRQNANKGEVIGIEHEAPPAAVQETAAAEEFEIMVSCPDGGEKTKTFCDQQCTVREGCPAHEQPEKAKSKAGF